MTPAMKNGEEFLVKVQTPLIRTPLTEPDILIYNQTRAVVSLVASPEIKRAFKKARINKAFFYAKLVPDVDKKGKFKIELGEFSEVDPGW